nr:MAG TPA: hypothetical protein [Caudoviricetes sp.]
MTFNIFANSVRDICSTFNKIKILSLKSFKIFHLASWFHHNIVRL